MDTKSSLHDNAEYEQAKEELKSSAASISTTSTALEPPPPYTEDDTAFKPGRSLFIDARGMALIRLPVPSSQLEIPINNSDGSLAYISTREKRSSSDSILSSPKLGSLVSTTYFFGPKRNPVIRLLQSASPEPQEVKITGKWTSRLQNFQMPDGSQFEWRYVRQRDISRSKLLVLEKKDGPSSTAGRRLAQLVRNEHTRPYGAGETTAGNGGELVIHQDAYLEIDEALITATCLLMLKKEMDRRRLLQFMVLGGGGGGG